MEKTNYSYKTTVTLPFERTIEMVIAELKKEGFVVLTEIDLKDSFDKKFDINLRKFKILGAYNPPNSYKFLQVEADIGLMLPLNVLVYEGDGGKTVVATLDPLSSMIAFTNRSFIKFAFDLQTKLERVIKTIDV